MISFNIQLYYLFFCRYNAVTGILGSLQWLAKKDNCRVCGHIKVVYNMDKSNTLQDLLDKLLQDDSM